MDRWWTEVSHSSGNGQPRASRGPAAVILAHYASGDGELGIPGDIRRAVTITQIEPVMSAKADVRRPLQYEWIASYAQGGGLTRREWEKRERLRLETAERCARGKEPDVDDEFQGRTPSGVEGAGRKSGNRGSSKGSARVRLLRVLTSATRPLSVKTGASAGGSRVACGPCRVLSRTGWGLSVTPSAP